MTESAFGRPCAASRVPSRGSTAMSTRGSEPSPTRSPLWSIGASSFSPSPITTTPSMWTVWSTWRIASTAAWSAASLSPMPIRRAVASAAASVTRTISSARLRSGRSDSGSEVMVARTLIGPNAVGPLVGSAAVPDVRWGLTVPFAGVSLADHADLFRRAEGAGYDDLWTSETAGYDGFTPLALAAAHTRRVRLATGIVNPFTRGPAVLAQHAAALADASGGRFVLGLGSSSNVIVERWNGVPFVKPLSKVREAVEALRPILAGERGPGGFKLETAPSHP